MEERRKAGKAQEHQQRGSQHVVRPAPVLVVDDDAGIRDMLAAVLEDEGFVVTTAAHGTEALERITAQRPSVIITDVRMPVMDGPTFVRRYRVEHAAPHAPVIAIAASRTGLDDAEAMGVDAALPKPVDFEQLISVVRRCAAGANRRYRPEHGGGVGGCGRRGMASRGRRGRSRAGGGGVSAGGG